MRKIIYIISTKKEIQTHGGLAYEKTRNLESAVRAANHLVKTIG